MEWLSQNWIWLAFAVGMVLMMRRGGSGGGGCCGGGHDAGKKSPAVESPETKSAGVGGSQPTKALAGGCCGGGHGTGDKRPEVEGAQNAAVAEHQHQGAAQR